MAHFTRREFLKTGLAAGTLACPEQSRSASSAGGRPTWSRWVGPE